MAERELAARALETAKSRGASYADIRITRYLRQAINTREKRVTNITNSESFGFGVRVLVDGTWGFAASQRVEPAEIDRIIEVAVGIARANRRAQSKPVVLAPVKSYKDTWQTPTSKDPFKVPIERKIDLLLAINAAAWGTRIWSERRAG